MPRSRKNSGPAKTEVNFRLLCKSHVFGGLIGHNGTKIKSLETSTSAKISAGDPTPSVNHRIVHVIASPSLNRSITLDGVNIRVSPAQVALIRVFDRILEEDGGGKGEDYVKCSLVVKKGMVGAVIGEGGRRIDVIENETKAFVKILPIDFPPDGATLDDEIVQVTGRRLCVKKALVMISQYLQQRAIDIEEGFACEAPYPFPYQCMKMDTSNAEVVFKLLCDNKAIGWVIGLKGRRVRSIENDTGASILFPAANAGSFDSVVTVSAFENKESQNSHAQNATVRVFDEIAKSEKVNTRTARLVIRPYQSDWLTDGEVSIISTIHKDCGATLKIKEVDDWVVGATADDKVLEIDGDYPDVTWALREQIFDVMLPKDSIPLLPHKLFNLPSEGNKISALTNKMNKCRVSEKSTCTPPPVNPESKGSAGSSLSSRSRSSGESATTNCDSSFCSGYKTFVVLNKTLEIGVHEDVFAAVYGEKGSNLSRLRMISGATVEVQDPSAGNDGKVIISGTSEQTLVAQSLLQAFLMSA